MTKGLLSARDVYHAVGIAGFGCDFGKFTGCRGHWDRLDNYGWTRDGWYLTLTHQLGYVGDVRCSPVALRSPAALAVRWWSPVGHDYPIVHDLRIADWIVSHGLPSGAHDWFGEGFEGRRL